MHRYLSFFFFFFISLKHCSCLTTSKACLQPWSFKFSSVTGLSHFSTLWKSHRISLVMSCGPCLISFSIDGNDRYLDLQELVRIQLFLRLLFSSMTIWYIWLTQLLLWYFLNVALEYLQTYKEQIKRESVLTATSILNNPIVKARYERYVKVSLQYGLILPAVATAMFKIHMKLISSNLTNPKLHLMLLKV